MTVYLVGAGPGDPGLLTRRGAELLAQANVVVHDRLIDPRLLELVSSQAIVVDVGKSAGSGASQQKAINELLIEYGQHHECVVRLKGGDPFVFGRGGEEALALESAGQHYEVISGVSSFASVPAAAGVPLTMRGLASSFTVVTGYDANEQDGDVTNDWDAIGRSRATIVVLMGAARRREIADRLIASGRDGQTPVVVVENGTTARQVSRRTTLAGLGDTLVNSPATIVIGEVARCTFATYEDRPLSSWRVVITRDGEHSREFARLIEQAGGESVMIPTIAIADPSDEGKSLRAALARIEEFDWIVFASKNAVERTMGELRDARSLAAVRVAAIGTSTASALAMRGIVADFVPTRFVAESFVEEFPAASADQRGRVLVPRAASGRDVIEIGLRQRGWDVEVVEAYQTIHPSIDEVQLTALREADVVTFTSSSTVTGLLAAADRFDLPAVIASIGPITSATAQELGVSVTLEAVQHTLDGLLDAIVAYALANPRT